MNPDMIRLVLITSCFFVEFIYLSKTTEMIVVPNQPHRMNSLHELLQKGWKLMVFPFTKSVAVYQLQMVKAEFQRTMRDDLRIEGFNVSELEDSKYWMDHVYKDSIASRSPAGEIQQYDHNNFINYRGVRPVPVQSISNFKILYPDPYFGADAQTHDGRCNHVPKLYSKSVRFNIIYSRNRWDVYKILTRLLYDSGVRKFWMNLQISAFNRASIITKSYDVAAVKLFDYRTLAVFGIACIGWAASFCVLLWEKHRPTHVTLFVAFKQNPVWIRVWKMVIQAFLMTREVTTRYILMLGSCQLRIGRTLWRLCVTCPVLYVRMLTKRFVSELATQWKQFC